MWTARNLCVTKLWTQINIEYFETVFHDFHSYFITVNNCIRTHETPFNTIRVNIWRHQIGLNNPMRCFLRKEDQSVYRYYNDIRPRGDWTPGSWALLGDPLQAQLHKNFPVFVRKMNIHYHVHKSHLLIPILSRINPVHTTLSYLAMIHFNIILPPTPTSS
jgi:hypothetical protein